MKKSKRPVVLTVNGKADAVVQDAESYQGLLDSVRPRADVYEAVRQGVERSSTDRRARRARYSTSCAAAMAYLVELTLRAGRDLDHLYQRIRADDSKAAAGWFNGIERAISKLGRLPRRCPVSS